MTADPFNARRLAQLVALFDSPAEGERHAALAAASRLLGRCGLAWRDVGHDVAGVIAASSPDLPPHAVEARRLLAAGLSRGRLTPWEAEFLRGIVGFRQLTVKQKAALQRLAAKVA